MNDTSLKISLSDAIKIWEEDADEEFLLRYLQNREYLMKTSTLSAASIIWLLNNLKVYGVKKLHSFVITHLSSFTAYEKQSILMNSIVQKTITLKLSDVLILCSGFGDFKISKNLVIEIGNILGISRKKSKECIINPESFSPEKEFGLKKGMVSTFLPPKKIYNISGVFLLDSSFEKNAEISVSLSLNESLLISNSLFKKLLINYAEYAYPNLLFRVYQL